MDLQLLIDTGLTEAQAKAYSALIEHSPITPPHLSDEIRESRTNTYKILEQLEEMGLARKDDIKKKMHYWALNPSALFDVVEQELSEVELKRRKIEASMASLQESYLEHNERPGVRHFQGVDGLKAIYQDQINENKEIVYLRATSDIRGFTDNELHKIRNLFPANNIKRRAITQDRNLPQPEPGPRVPIKESDQAMMLERTWIDECDYDAPVEWSAYGDKLSIISFGDEAMGMIIESPQIAEGFRQMFSLLDEGIRRRPDYHEMPRNVKTTAMPESMKGSQVATRQ